MEKNFLAQVFLFFLYLSLFVVLYPFLFVLCIIGIGIRLIMLLTLIVPILTAIGLFLFFPIFVEVDIADLLGDYLGNHPLTQIVAFVIGAVVFVDSLKRIGESVRLDLDTFSDGWQKIRNKDPFCIKSMKIITDMEIIDRFGVAWSKYFTKIKILSIMKIPKAAWKLSSKLVIVATLAWIAYPFIESRRNADSINTCDRIIFSVTFDNWTRGSANGICLDETRKNWINKFRRSIVKYAELQESTKGSTGKVPTLKVTGFASKACVKSNSDKNNSIKKNNSEQTCDKNSPRQNCEIANHRAIAVGAFLANRNSGDKTKWSCSSSNSLNTKNPCSSKQQSEYMSSDESFKVYIHQWTNPEKMQKNRPVHSVELLNRSVLITVPSDLCKKTG